MLKCYMVVLEKSMVVQRHYYILWGETLASMCLYVCTYKMEASACVVCVSACVYLSISVYIYIYCGAREAAHLLGLEHGAVGGEGRAGLVADLTGALKGHGSHVPG